MSNRNVFVGSVVAAWLLLAVFAWLSLFQPAEVEVLTAGTGESRGESHLAETTIAVHGATEEQLARLELAVERFERLGLHLPPLEVSFPESSESCDEHKGRFSAGTAPWSIWICSPEIESLYEHELAHAWIEANVDEAVRSRFLTMRDLSNWNDPEVAWNERGTEWAAVIVQQGLSGLSLPSSLPNEFKSRMAAFELLTGTVAPVLVEWIEERDIPCPDRPTELSLHIVDKSARGCPVSPSVSINQSQRRTSRHRNAA